MEFFDCNVMLGQTVTPLPSGALDVRSLLAEMDRLKIEQTLFFHYAFTMDQKTDMNRLTLAAARESSRLIPTWVLSTVLTRMQEKLEDQIDRMLNSGVKVARIFVDEAPQAGPLSLKLYLLESLDARMNQHPSLGLGMILYAALNDGDKQLIAAGNLTRLLGSVR